MSLTNIAIAAQRMFFMEISAGIAGSIITIFVILLRNIRPFKYSRLLFIYSKLALVMYLLPVGAVYTMLSRVQFTFLNAAWTSGFWSVSALSVRNVFVVAMIIWVTGLAVGIVLRVYQYIKLHRLFMGNIPLNNKFYDLLVEEYRIKYGFKKVLVYQNDMVGNPVCTGSIHPQIILPVKLYTEKELRMILEHEFCHIRRHHLAWKKTGLLATFFHWWNPFVYILLKEIIFQEEVEADIQSCDNSGGMFTMKEYGMYLAGLDEEEKNDDMVFSSALCSPKKYIFRRIESMVRAKKHKKWTALVTCLLLFIMSAVPSYAASEEMAKLNEKVTIEDEAFVKATAAGTLATVVTEDIGNEIGVNEIDLTQDGVEPYSSLITLDSNINPGTRLLYSFKSMDVGDSIYINARCSNSAVTYRIGIKCSDNTVTYISGSGNLSYDFAITKAGSYSAFVENRSSVTMTVTGSALYNR